MRHDFPLLRYPGSKAKKAKLIASLLPDHDEYREPFIGSAAVLARIDPSKRRWINDKSPHIAGFHQFVRDNPNAIAEIQKLIDDSQCPKFRRERFETAKRNFVSGVLDPLGYLLMSRYSYSGIVTKHRPDVASYQDYSDRYGFRCLHTKQLHFWKQLLQQVTITNTDYSELIETPGDNVALFLDPPYIINDNGSPIYDLHWDEQEHERLAKLLRSCKHKFLMTINRSALTLSLYARKPFRLMRSSYAYTISHQSRQQRKHKQLPPSTELIVCNY